ncbi:helix-turn-helix domain-containing protein [Methylobacterium sp. J-076]|uniref:helix-turn-helix domain-containing protein n=1 Tax=Methylobacterium sp. J-076 TaxID=2836655 RepID=UPI001FB9B9CB|nr:helix-turn-helix domain-containing protein [Methylobacterium sp. J-076]MCJ2012655.1 helix-turn-helix domain-containing protein [Methylobacterium sp. J-076]
MVADEIRRAIETATRLTLPTVTALLWRAYGEERITEAEAEALSGLIEARQVSGSRRGENAGQSGISNLSAAQVLRSPDPGTSNAPGEGIAMFSDNQRTTPDRQRSPRTGAGSRPVSGASLERRRRWAASGRLPPAIATRFSLAEQAALALIAAETTRKGDCRLAIEHLAAVAGVSRSSVKNAIREARKLGLLTVEERRVTAFRNLPNIVRIVSLEWTAWLRLGRKGVTDRAPLGREVMKRHPITSKGVVNRHLPQGGGVKSVTGTPTQISKQGKTRTEGLMSRPLARAKALPRGASRIAGA